MLDIKFKPRAIKDLKALSTKNQQRILDKIEVLQNDLCGDVKHLTDYSPEYRLRIGNYRVLFELEQQTVMIYRIVHRREAYK